jgi:RNA polymerase sigma-70 factor (ECF subfamily)
MKFDAAATIRDQIDELYRSECRRVFASLVRLLKDFDLADDAMHEAMGRRSSIRSSDFVFAGPSN